MSEGECEPVLNGCSLMCPETISPVCAINSEGLKRSFNNDCNLKANNCYDGEDFKFQSVGKCIDPISRCKLTCTKEYDPICGENSNGDIETFSNLCDMGRINCDKDTGLYKFKYFRIF